MWLSFAVIGFAITSYAMEKLSLELTSLITVVSLLLVFQIVPASDGFSHGITPRALLAGFADPALMAILALLVVGQGLVQTGALDNAAQSFTAKGMNNGTLLISITLIIVLITSAFMNNTPVVVIFIPIVSAMAAKLGRSASLVMIPLSFAAILGGNLTVIGSSTNLLVSGTVEQMGLQPMSFFEFTIPGLVLAGVGLLYLFFVTPILLHDRASIAGKMMDGEGGRHFIVQIEVNSDSPLNGLTSTAGMFPSLKDITVRLVQRGEQAIFPPFDDLELKQGDILVMAATRKALTALLKESPDIFRGHIEIPDNDDESNVNILAQKEQMLAEAIIAPVSRMAGMTLADLGFHARTNCIVLGIQRRSRMIRSSIDNIHLAPGDVLLLMGPRNDMFALRSSRDLLLMEWSAKDLPRSTHAPIALGIFASVVGLSATSILPITVAAMAGAAAMIVFGCLTLRQSFLAVDKRIMLLIGASLAMGVSLSGTGGAQYIATHLLSLFAGAGPAVILSVLFLIVAIITNILSNNATAVLFTPIAISAALNLGVDPHPFIIAVIFAANCSFATPMGYQTNLLVMGPGHYKFRDFTKVGIPLIFILWATYTIFAPWYYNLG